VAETGCCIDEALRFTVEDIQHDKNQIILWTRKAKNSNLTPDYIPKPECLEGMSLPRTGRVFTKWKPAGYPKFLKFEVEHAINEPSLADPEYNENGHIKES